ncbi:MAG: DUF2085 domain-containing protein [Candidatus Thermoplasmatota archaeon]
MKDLRARMFFSRVLFATLLLSLFYTVSNFVAPYAIPAGTAVALDGSANVVDNGALYNRFPAYPMVIYYVGDAQCHQMAVRTIVLNGNQMPMDARMTSIYLFANLGLISAIFAAPSTSIAEGLLNAFPKRLAAWGRQHLGPGVFAAVVVFLGILPVAADGFTQLLTPYESTNATRVLTGIPTGWVAGLLVGVMMTSIRQVGIETAALRSRIPAA